MITWNPTRKKAIAGPWLAAVVKGRVDFGDWDVPKSITRSKTLLTDFAKMIIGENRNLKVIPSTVFCSTHWHSSRTKKRIRK